MPESWLFSRGRAAAVHPGFILLLFLVFANSLYSTPASDLAQENLHIEKAIGFAKAGNLSSAKTEYDRFNERWFVIEDGIKKVSRAAYKDIESAMGDVRFSFAEAAAPGLVTALSGLRDRNQKFISGGYQSMSPDVSSNQAGATVESELALLEQAMAVLGVSPDVSAATKTLKEFQQGWFDIEGAIGLKSQSDYAMIENEMTVALFKLSKGDATAAKESILRMQETLIKYRGEQKYSIFDASTILIREGLEALLVIVALLSFIEKSGHANKKLWIWVGAFAGVIASIVAAAIVHFAFRSVSLGANRELVEGVTGLVAAVLLIYVSYWLHSKSSLMAWQGFIKSQVQTALATNSLFSLGLLSFLAVFREGAETTLFYMGIASAIETRDLFFGIGIGTVALIVCSILMFYVGVRVPLKQFFTVTSLLIYYLAFKFIGSGIHALQVSGYLKSTHLQFLPSVSLLGLYPTLESTLPQLALLIIAIAVVIYTGLKKNQLETKT